MYTDIDVKLKLQAHSNLTFDTMNRTTIDIGQIIILVNNILRANVQKWSCID